jgi:hypothetical protein
MYPRLDAAAGGPGDVRRLVHPHLYGLKQRSVMMEPGFARLGVIARALPRLLKHSLLVRLGLRSTNLPDSGFELQTGAGTMDRPLREPATSR